MFCHVVEIHTAYGEIVRRDKDQCMPWPLTVDVQRSIFFLNRKKTFRSADYFVFILQLVYVTFCYSLCFGLAIANHARNKRRLFALCDLAITLNLNALALLDVCAPIADVVPCRFERQKKWNCAANRNYPSTVTNSKHRWSGERAIRLFVELSSTNSNSKQKKIKML